MKTQKSTYQWTDFFGITKKKIFFSGFLPKMRFFHNPALSLFYSWNTTTSYAISEKSYRPFLRKSDYWLTEWLDRPVDWMTGWLTGWLADWLNHWQWLFHRTPFHLKVGVQNRLQYFGKANRAIWLKISWWMKI